MALQHFGSDYSGSPPANYERYFVPAIGAPVAEDLVRTARLKPAERVLDVACGTGVVARMASDQVSDSGRVAGLDVNPGMLAVARATAGGRPIEWHEASAESMPLPARAFDVVLCQMGLQFVPDRAAALREMRRVLAGGGRLVLNVTGPIPPPFAVMAEALARHVGPEAAGFVGAVFSLHDESDIRDLVSGAGFRDVSVEAYSKRLTLPPPEQFLWQYISSTPLASIVGSQDEARRAALRDAVVAGWQPFVADGDLVADVRVVVATGGK